MFGSSGVSPINHNRHNLAINIIRELQLNSSARVIYSSPSFTAGCKHLSQNILLKYSNLYLYILIFIDMNTIAKLSQQLQCYHNSEMTTL